MKEIDEFKEMYVTNLVIVLSGFVVSVIRAANNRKIRLLIRFRIIDDTYICFLIRIRS